MRVRVAAGIRGQLFRPRPPPRHPNTLGGEPDVRNRRTGRTGRGLAPDDGLGDGHVPVAPRTGRHAADRLGGRAGGAGHEHPADRPAGTPGPPVPASDDPTSPPTGGRSDDGQARRPHFRPRGPSRSSRLRRAARSPARGGTRSAGPSGPSPAGGAGSCPCSRACATALRKCSTPGRRGRRPRS